MDRECQGGQGAPEEISALNHNYLQELPGSSMPHTHTHKTSDAAPPAGGHQHTSTVVKPPGSVGSAGLNTWYQSDPFSPDALRQSGEALPTRGRSLFATWHFKGFVSQNVPSETTTVRAASSVAGAAAVTAAAAAAATTAAAAALATPDRTDPSGSRGSTKRTFSSLKSDKLQLSYLSSLRNTAVHHRGALRPTPSVFSDTFITSM